MVLHTTRSITARPTFWFSMMSSGMVQTKTRRLIITVDSARRRWNSSAMIWPRFPKISWSCC